MQPTIKQVVVLGSGVMGSRIACHFAGIGVQVLLLDRLHPGTEESTQSKERNKLVNDALQANIFCYSTTINRGRVRFDSSL